MDDKSILAPLINKYLNICNSPIMDFRRSKWSSLHSLEQKNPLIHTRFFAFHEMEESKCYCKNMVLREVEYQLRRNIFWYLLGDDSVFEPWVQLRAVFRQSLWGTNSIVDAQVDGEHIKSKPVIDDLRAWKNVLSPPVHLIDEIETNRKLDIAQSAIGNLIEIDMLRTPYYSHWHGELSTDIGLLRGINALLYDVIDQPLELHQLVSWMSEQIINVQIDAEAQGDWSLTSSVNQSMTYAHELPAPAANSYGVRQNQLWGFLASQEFTMISPQMWDEFLLEYQKPILARYGLTAYGCCEDLTNKIPYLKRIPNLRRVAVSPFARLEECVKQLEDAYVISYRPNPTEMVALPVDEHKVTKQLEQDLSILKGTFFDITLKDVETVGHDPDRVQNWVKNVRRVCDRLGY